MRGKDGKQGLDLTERNKWGSLNGGICGICVAPELNADIEMDISYLIAVNQCTTKQQIPKDRDEKQGWICEVELRTGFACGVARLVK